MGLPSRELSIFLRTWGFVPAAFSLPAIVSSMFLHGGLMHIGGNMLYLWIFGDNVEDRMGHGRFVLFYLLAVRGGARPDGASPTPRADGGRERRDRRA